MTTYQLTTAKSTSTHNSLSGCVIEQREMQGSFAEVSRMAGQSVMATVSVDDDHIDWSESDESVVAQIEHALSLE